MMINKVEISGLNSLKLPVLKEKQMKDLLYRMQNGEYECRETFINENLSLVLSVLQHFNNRGENIDELFQVGYIGLNKSMDNFDLSQNIRFSTYAIPIIIGEIRRYLSDTSSIKISISLKDIAHRALQVRDRLLNWYNKEPTISQIAKELELPSEDVVFALDALQDPAWLYASHDSSDGIYVLDQIIHSKDLDDSWYENISINKVKKKLNKKEKLILSLRFAHGRTQMEVAHEIGISQKQVSRLEKAALKNIRKYV